MLAYALRRFLWTLPALIVVSVVTFAFLSLVPDPCEDPAVTDGMSPSELEQMRRERFVDLPRFFNVAPRDVRERAAEIVGAFERGGPDAASARAEVARLGGAALPYILPRFLELDPARRVDLALALEPVAARMGLKGRELTDPTRAVGFWTRFWDDRGVEFRRASVRSALRRVARYGSASRASDLFELDSFVLDEVMAELDDPEDDTAVARARPLIDIAAHVTGRDDRIAEGASVADAASVVARWRSFWSVYRVDYTSDVGVDRVAEAVLETRYGKWAYEAVTTRFGRGEPSLGRAQGYVLDQLRARAPVTLAIVVGAVSLSYSVAIPLGALAAFHQRRRVNATIVLLVLGAYAVPTAVVALAVQRANGAGMVAAIGVLAVGLLAAPTAQERASLAELLSSEFVRAARARGASRSRAAFVHAFRSALLPVSTLATREGPMALGGAFVVERVFGLHGAGEATITAVAHHDTGWLMALSMVAALLAAIIAALADIGGALIDPRLRAPMLARRGRG